jgi:uncharacterized membrane protein (UPF0127 family)
MFSGFSSGSWRSAGWIIIVALLANGCARSEPRPTPPPKTVGDWLVLKVGDRTVHGQLAIHAPEMERGLMGRRELARDQGMLFVYREPSAMSFWMRSTPLPLDIGFFSADGELTEIYTMLPYDETPVRSRSGQLQFALEMNRGWFHDNDIKPGARLDLMGLREALKARGVAPEDYGLR